MTMSDFLRWAGHPTKLQVLLAIERLGLVGAAGIAKVTKLNQGLISRLTLDLYNLGLVLRDKLPPEGGKLVRPRYVFRVRPEALAWLAATRHLMMTISQESLNHAQEAEPEEQVPFTAD